MAAPLRRADVICKIVIIGDSGVGKTSVMRRFTDDDFTYNFAATIGIDFKIRMMEIRDRLVKVQIWDTAGQEKFRSITTAYYRGAKGVIITYDITSRKSFEHVSNWITNIKRWADGDVERMLIGNKCDKEDTRCVERREGEVLARENNMLFNETSAKDNINVDHVFMKLLDKIVAKEIKRKEANAKKNETVDIDGPSNNEKHQIKCCNR